MTLTCDECGQAYDELQMFHGRAWCWKCVEDYESNYSDSFDIESNY